MLIVSVAGASGSGKSNTTRGLVRLLGRDVAVSYALDGYHYHDREERTKLNEFPEQPSANDFDRIKKDLVDLINNKFVFVPVYDHSSGKKLAKQRLIRLKEVLLIEGLHAGMIASMIYPTNLCSLLSIYVDTDTNIRMGWKTKRDIIERNYDYHQTEYQNRHRLKYEKEYIYWQLHYAHIILHIGRARNQKGNDVTSSLRVTEDVIRIVNMFMNDVGLPRESFVYYKHQHKTCQRTLFSLHIGREDLVRQSVIEYIHPKGFRYDIIKPCRYGNNEYISSLKTMAYLIIICKKYKEYLDERY
jgi:uridine kinase